MMELVIVGFTVFAGTFAYMQTILNSVSPPNIVDDTTINSMTFLQR